MHLDCQEMLLKEVPLIRAALESLLELERARDEERRLMRIAYAEGNRPLNSLQEEGQNPSCDGIASSAPCSPCTDPALGRQAG